LLTSDEPVVRQFLGGRMQGPIGMAEEKDAAQVEQELAQLDHPAKTPGSQDLTPRLLPGPGILRPPRWEAIARREAELRRKEVAGA
jgi:phospholipid/cholesterol/gamma-HCH transport system ATP-binding protein